MASFDDILNSLLEEVEKNPNVDITTIVGTKAEELGLDANVEEIVNANSLIERFDENYSQLVKEKEEEGVSTEAWMRKKIMASATEGNLSDEDKVKFFELLAEAGQKNNDETIDNLG